MDCTLCGDPAVVHFVGHHPKVGYATTGVARCEAHRAFGLTGRDFEQASIGVFFERVENGPDGGVEHAD